MFFLLRMAFWLGVVCLLLPSIGSHTTPKDAQVNAAEAVTVASAAVSDASGFCDRQPTACQVGSKVAVALGHKAEAGARTLYDFISATVSGSRGDQVAADSRLAKVMPVLAPGNGTLTESDLKAPWHEPVPLPPRRQVRMRPSA
ncbi:MAG TPA: DUF5330 domain-containing protein [Pseudolabrys sp.]|nr:DUF5330 domain-containing protein [Pseudolabrys sp.]